MQTAYRLCYIPGKIKHQATSPFFSTILTTFFTWRNVMKKRLLSMLLVLVMMLGLIPTTAFAASSEQEALGEIDIYNGGVKMSYLSINGRIREQIYTYYNHVTPTGSIKEVPAYCVNPNDNHLRQKTQSPSHIPISEGRLLLRCL